MSDDLIAMKTKTGGLDFHLAAAGCYVPVMMLNYIVPDFVHVLKDGRIVRSGGRELALQLEDQGYDWIEAEPAVVGA